MKTARIALTALPLLAPALPAGADGTFPANLSAADRQLLATFDAARNTAIALARDEGEAADVAVLNRALEGQPTAMKPGQIAGDWRCRSIQLGGTPPVVAYGEFRCRITDDAGGLQLRKLGGSQRTNGTFHDIGEARLGYAGALTFNNDPVLRYGQNTERDQIGYLVPIAPNHLRLELPDRHGGGGFEIIDFRR